MVTRTPEWLYERRLALHELVADEIRRNPAMFERVRSNLHRWNTQRTSAGASYLAWLELVDAGMEASLAAATERSERGDVLRVSSPFTGVLSEASRLAFLASWRGRGDRAG